MVNNRGEVLMDTFVCPDEPVTRCRFAITGIHRSDLKNAPAFAKVQSLVRSLLEGRILVGHALHYDLAVRSHVQASDLSSYVEAKKHDYFNERSACFIASAVKFENFSACLNTCPCERKDDMVLLKPHMPASNCIAQRQLH